MDKTISKGNSDLLYPVKLLRIRNYESPVQRLNYCWSESEDRRIIFRESDNLQCIFSFLFLDLFFMKCRERHNEVPNLPTRNDVEVCWLTNVETINLRCENVSWSNDRCVVSILGGGCVRREWGWRGRGGVGGGSVVGWGGEGTGGGRGKWCSN